MLVHQFVIYLWQSEMFIHLKTLFILNFNFKCLLFSYNNNVLFELPYILLKNLASKYILLSDSFSVF